MAENISKALKEARKIVIKIGSNTLAKPDGTQNTDFMASFAKQCADLINQGKQIVIVSSGAQVAGVSTVNGWARKKDVHYRQALCSIGQVELMHQWRKAFQNNNLHIGQLLLTKDDFENDHRSLNIRNTLFTLVDEGIVPIINENDSVSFDEIKRILKSKSKKKVAINIFSKSFQEEGHPESGMSMLIRRLKNSRSALVKILALAIAGSVGSVFSLTPKKDFIDQVMNNNRMDLYAKLLITMAFFFLFQIVISAVKTNVIAKESRKDASVSGAAFFKKMLSLPYSFFDEHSAGELIQRLENNINSSRSLLTAIVPKIIASSISFATETPSFVITGEPYFLSIITIRPQGPKVVFTALEICSTPLKSFLRASSLNNNCFAIYIPLINIL